MLFEFFLADMDAEEKDPRENKRIGVTFDSAPGTIFLPLPSPLLFFYALVSLPPLNATHACAHGRQASESGVHLFERLRKRWPSRIGFEATVVAFIRHDWFGHATGTQPDVTG